ncbi:hypothetical protein JKP88DRAFT_350356 [Tribonema minus]|uniref:Uncharacterized protein n=1 Tax=Tribonema minus TaxID=303371 RepID=A0A835YMX2_9STRA|nr:hypothetical protein JKP88DRAFT_350356 [Tribonema minus]
MHSIGMAFLNEPMYSTTASFDGLSWQLAVKRAIGVEEQTTGCKLCGKSPGGTLHARLCQAPRVKAHDTIVHNSVKRATQRILRQYLKTGLVDEDYTPFLGSAGPPGSRRMDIVLPADAFPVTGYDDPTRHLPLMVDVTCFEAQVASRAAKTAADPERCCRDQEAAKTTHYSGHYDQNCYKLATLAIGSFGSIGEQGRKLLETVVTECASRMSVPGGARPKALKGIALARLRSALSAALHMAAIAYGNVAGARTLLEAGMVGEVSYLDGDVQLLKLAYFSGAEPLQFVLDNICSIFPRVPHYMLATVVAHLTPPTYDDVCYEDGAYDPLAPRVHDAAAMQAVLHSFDVEMSFANACALRKRKEPVIIIQCAVRAALARRCATVLRLLPENLFHKEQGPRRRTLLGVDETYQHML